MKLTQAKLTDCFQKSLIISEITEEGLKKDGVLILMSLWLVKGKHVFYFNDF
jgi:hypothetical protein